MTIYQVKLVEKSSQTEQIVELVQGKNVVNIVKTPNKHNITVIEKTTGKSPKTLQMKRKGKDLLVELEDETTIKFVDYYSSEEVTFIGELDAGLTVYDVPTVEIVSTSQPMATSASATSIGKVVAGVSLALGGIAGLASAGGGGKSGGSSDSTPNTNNTPQNTKPTAIQLSKNTVNENEKGAVIGKLTTTDTDKNDTHTYTVSDDRFEVVNGELKLKNGVSLDYETVKSINVKVTSKDKGGLSTEQNFTILVNDINETPVTPPPPPANAKVASIKADSSVNEGQTLTATVTLDNQNGNSNLAFKLDGLETTDYNNLVFSNGVTRNNDGTLNIPKNVKTFNVSLNIIADNTTEGEQSLTLTVGDKPAIVKVADTSVTPPPPANAKVASIKADSSVNEGQTLTATVTLDNQNGHPNLAFKLDGLETADYNNLVFSNGVTRNSNGTLNIPKNVKTFNVSLNIIADNTTEGEQSLNLTVGDKPAIVKVADTSVTPPPPANAKVASIKADSSVNEGQTLTATVTLDNQNGNPNLAFKLDGLETADYNNLVFSNGVTRNSNGTLNIPKNVKTFNVSLNIIADNTTEGEQSLNLTVGDKPAIVKVADTSVTPPPPANAKVASIKADSSVNEGQTLTATVTLDNQNGHPNLAFKLDGLETADYNNLVFSNGVTRNSNGTLNIPKNVKTFNVSLNIIADNTTEGEQSLTLTVGDKPAIVKVVDTSVTPPPPANAQVASIKADSSVNEGQTLTATVTLDNQNGNPNLAFKLDGLETADYNNLVFSNGVTRNSNGGTLNIPKNVKTFTVSLNIIADNTTEGEQSLNLTVGDKSTVVKVEDTSITPPPPADAKVASVTAGEKVNEGQTLTATVTLDNQNGHPNLAFNLAGLETADYNNLVFSNGVSRNSNGTLNVPKNVKTFTVSLNIIADNTTEGEQSLTLTVGDKPAIVKVVDTSITPPPPANAQVASIKADSSVNEGQTLTATVTLDNQNGHPNLAFNLAGLETADYNNLVFSNGVSRNSNGTLNVPKNVKTFTVSLNIIADNTTEGEQSLTLTVGDKPTVVKVIDTSTTPVQNQAPTDIRLDKNVVKENAQDVVIGNLTTNDPDQNDTFTYTITDSNSPFEIANGNQLKLKTGQSFDFENTKNVVVNIKTTDAGGLSINKAFTINVENVNEQPTEITLSGSKAVDENAVGAPIGTLTTTDPDVNDTFTYRVSDSRFEVVNGQLKLKAGQSLNYEDSPTVRLEITSTDAGGKFITSPFEIKVNNVNEAPITIQLDKTSVKENDRGAVVGTLTTNDPDTADSHTYTVSGDDRFEIVGNQLKLKEGKFLDYEKDKTINLTITSSDGQLSKPQSFTITVTDVNDDGYIWGIDNLTYAKALNGTDNDDTLVGLKGKDYLRGGKGNDTYIFSKGDGLDEIEDWSDIAGEFNTIKFTDVNISDIQKISTIADGYLGLNIHYGDGDVIKLEEYSKQHTLSKVIFADGTTMSVADLMKKVPSHIEAVATNSIVADTVANDVITDSKGNHSYWGHSTVSGGNDTYVFKTGGGKDIIYEKDKQNKIVFTDVSSENITLSHHKDYVTIHYGNGDEVKFNPNAMSEIQFQDTTWNVSNLKEHLNLPYWTESLLFGYTQNSTYMDKNDDKVMYFAFPNTNLRTDHQDGWAAFTEAQKEVARKAFKNLEQFLPIKFIEKKEAPTQIEDDVIYLQNAKLAAGVAGLGGWNNKGGGDVWMGSSVVNDDTLHVIAHEIGHAIGLNHPQRYPNDPPIGEEGGQKRHSLNDAEDKGIWTIMSYDNKTRSSDYQEFDIAVLQYLYGVNPNVRTGDDQYFFNSSVGQFVWDGAGTDTINASSATENVYINLNAGTHSYIGQKSSITHGNQLTINHGTVIENATGGKGNDTLIGNTANNVLTGGAGNDTLTGGKGLDVFNFSPLTNDATGGHGHDTITDFYLGNIQQNTQADMLNLVGSLIGYNGDKSATSFNDYLSVTQQNGNTVLSIDRDGSGTAFAQADLVTLEKVQTSLAELLANQQIII